MHTFSYAPVKQSYVSLDLQDQKGREIGAIIMIRTHTVIKSAGSYSHSDADALPLGAEVVSVVVSAARDCCLFGASQSYKLIGPPGAATDLKVKAEIERRVASMTVRYRKQFAKEPS